MTKLEKCLLAANALICLALLVYSYAHVDLNLTLSGNNTVLWIIGKLQHLAYYQRPTSTLIYIGLISVFFAFFAVNLILITKKKLGIKYVARSTIILTAVLALAYPFLSSDLFNYMFDAKILTEYHANPYTNRPLDFPSDEWLRFMRWVHRYSPYGPLWLGISTIPSFLGFGKFITTLFAFKLFIGSIHLLNSWLIYKTLKDTKTHLATYGTAFYALNPLFLIEGVVNAHNDIVHAFFIILSVYILVSKKSAFGSLLSAIASSLIKYLGLLSVLPLILWRFTKYNKIDHYVLLNLLIYALFTFVYSTITISVPFVSSGSLQTQFQPWYLFWTLPLVAFVPNQKKLVISAFLIAIFAELRYLPYLFYGDWTNTITIPFMQLMVAIPAVISAGLLFQKLQADRQK